jgi:hypothetical protein
LKQNKDLESFISTHLETKLLHSSILAYLSEQDEKMHGSIGQLKGLDELHNFHKCKKIMETATQIVKQMEQMAKET